MKNGETDVVGKMQIIYNQNDWMLLGYCDEQLEKCFC
jgi:hypothetical protein